MAGIQKFCELCPTRIPRILTSMTPVANLVTLV